MSAQDFILYNHFKIVPFKLLPSPMVHWLGAKKEKEKPLHGIMIKQFKMVYTRDQSPVSTSNKTTYCKIS